MLQRHYDTELSGRASVAADGGHLSRFVEMDCLQLEGSLRGKCSIIGPD